MRMLLKSLFALGCIAAFGVFAYAVDQYATPERKEAFNSATGQIADAMAETPEDRNGSARGGKGLWYTVQTLANGVFRSSPVVLADYLPPAPEGWTRTDYTSTFGRGVTGVAADASYDIMDSTHHLLKRFNDAAGAKSLGTAMVYASGESFVAVRLKGELDDFRKADAGSYDEKRKVLAMPRPPSDARLYMKIDGVPVGVLPQFTQVADRRYPTEYRRFMFSLGRLVEGEVFARASDADIVRILSGIDIAGFQAALDEPTERYVFGKGIDWAGETPPSADMPPPTLAWRALGVIRGGGGPAREDFDELRAIAEGQVADWQGLFERFRASYDVTPELLDLLGEEPPAYAVRRLAEEALFMHGPRLDEDDRRALRAVSGGGVTTQAELRRLPYWQDDWAPEAETVFALLPE